MAAYFFDTSALAKLYHQEAGSDRVEELVRNPGHRILISRLAVVEMHSVFALKVRSQAINADDATALRRRFLSDIRGGVFEVLALAQTHYERAERLIASYGFHYRLGPSMLCNCPLLGSYQRACSTILWLQTEPFSRWRRWRAFR